MGDVVLLSESLEALLDLQATVAQPVTRTHAHARARAHTHTHNIRESEGGREGGRV